MKSRLTAAMPLMLALLWAGGVRAQALAPPTPQFDFLGFIQEATLDMTGAICTPGLDPASGLPSDRLRGGTITVNGIKMIVPCNTLLQLPAATMTWGDLFDPAMSAPVGSYIGAGTLDPITGLPVAPVPANPVALGAVKTGLALTDSPMPFPSFEVRVQGNVVNGQYLVGLIIPISQQGLNGSSGLVSYIDYTIGAFRVGGIPNDPACSANGITSPLCSGALVQVNDPVARWGLAHSPDPRFSGDYENTTVHASTGIPACIPRVAPVGTIDDPLCPSTNRPVNGDLRFPLDPFLAPGAPLKIFTMPAPVLDATTGLNTVTPDAYQQVPIMVGDQVVYAGTLFKINPLATIIDPFTGLTIPDNTAANTYISAHTVEDVLGIFTAPGVPPAYVTIEDFLIGTNGAAVQGILQEASTRLTVVGFTTDPTRLIDIYAQDVNPCTGVESLRLLATTDPATQAIVGRFVHRVLGGEFMPPTRNYVMKTRTQKLDPVTLQPVDLFAANGILTGQFLLPNFEYIFPENHRIGDPFIPFNFQDLPFLAQGSGPVDGAGSGTPVLAQLNPWPGSIAPPPVVCNGGAAPIVTFAINPVTAGTGAQVTINPTVTLDPGSVGATFLWTQIGGLGVTIANATAPSLTFTAPNAATALTFHLAVTDQFGTSGVSPLGDVTVNVTRLTDTVTFPAGVSSWAVARGKRGPFGKLNVTATSTGGDPAVPLTLTLEEVYIDATTGAQATISWGTGSADPVLPGTFNWVEDKGAPQPVLLNVFSSRGGFAQAVCGAPDGKGTVTCN